MSVEITTLPSGLRIVTHAMREIETTSLGIWVGAGARNEAEQEHGVSHLLEHMAFKGTSRRSARAIAEEIESVGGDLNAATSVEYTSYQARVLAQDSGLALDILSDILTDSVFDAAELEREKGVILQEIGEALDTPDDLVFDLFNDAAYPDQPIGRPILGTPERVSSFDAPAIRTYLDRHYATPLCVVAAAGALEHARIVDETARRFEGLARTPREAPAPARYRGGDLRKKRKLEQTHVVIGFESASYNDPATYAAHVFANAIGGGMSSRLFQEVREKRGLAYTIYSFQWGYADTGLFGFYAASSHRDVPDLVDVSLDCIARAAQDLSAEEMDRARAQAKVSLLTALESPAARADQIARQLLAFGRLITREEMIARIDALSLDEVRAAGIAALRSRPTVAVVGDAGRAPKPEHIASRLAGV
jgi:predicted Zn-dependent peptidase